MSTTKTESNTQPDKQNTGTITKIRRKRAIIKANGVSKPVSVWELVLLNKSARKVISQQCNNFFSSLF